MIKMMNWIGKIVLIKVLNVRSGKMKKKVLRQYCTLKIINSQLVYTVHGTHSGSAAP